MHSVYGDWRTRAEPPACMVPQPWWKYTLERLNVLTLLHTMRFYASRVISAPKSLNPYFWPARAPPALSARAQLEWNAGDEKRGRMRELRKPDLAKSWLGQWLDRPGYCAGYQRLHVAEALLQASRAARNTCPTSRPLRRT